MGPRQAMLELEECARSRRMAQRVNLYHGLWEVSLKKPVINHRSYQILNHCCFEFPASKTESEKFPFITPSKILFYRSQNSKQRPLPDLSTSCSASIYTYPVHSHHPVHHTSASGLKLRLHRHTVFIRRKVTKTQNVVSLQRLRIPTTALLSLASAGWNRVRHQDSG